MNPWPKDHATDDDKISIRVNPDVDAKIPPVGGGFSPARNIWNPWPKDHATDDNKSHL